MKFACNRWLAEDEDDGLIERELFPSEENELTTSKLSAVKNAFSVSSNGLLWYSDGVLVATNAEALKERINL